MRLARELVCRETGHELGIMGLSLGTHGLPKNTAGAMLLMRQSLLLLRTWSAKPGGLRA